jgi:hypothetical protein
LMPHHIRYSLVSDIPWVLERSPMVSLELIFSPLYDDIEMGNSVLV